jgi:homoserine/homoserine lactone efflux protein
MSAQALLLYFSTWLLVALTPGPAVICVMSQAARYGPSAGFLSILGIQLGNLIFFLCIASGLVAALATVSTAFTILQFAGAGYLLYFGLRIIVSRVRKPPPDALYLVWAERARRNFVLQGLAVQLTNPKALLFVSALLPQFLDPQQHVAPQLTVFLTCTVVVDGAVLGSYALFAHPWYAGPARFPTVELDRMHVWRGARRAWTQAS